MDKKAKKSEYNRKFRELQKSKGEIKTTEPKVISVGVFIIPMQTAA